MLEPDDEVTARGVSRTTARDHGDAGNSAGRSHSEDRAAVEPGAHSRRRSGYERLREELRFIDEQLVDRSTPELGRQGGEVADVAPVARGDELRRPVTWASTRST